MKKTFKWTELYIHTLNITELMNMKLNVTHEITVSEFKFD